MRETLPQVGPLGFLRVHEFVHVRCDEWQPHKKFDMRFDDTIGVALRRNLQDLVEFVQENRRCVIERVSSTSVTPQERMAPVSSATLCPKEKPEKFCSCDVKMLVLAAGFFIAITYL